jgi:3-oxoacyl-[acyl-carrier-protein] synthase-3
MLFVHGIGHFHPENEITNAFLENLGIGTTEQWILERVGIRTRRTVLPLDYIRDSLNRDPAQGIRVAAFTNRQTGARAARLALERAGIQATQVGMVISGSCTPQYCTPAEACTIAAELGITGPAFDLNSACSSFAVHLNLVRSMRPELVPDYILLVTPENTTRLVNYSDRSSSVLWGDASAAAVVSLKKKSRFRIPASLMESDNLRWEKVSIPPGEHFRQEGAAVQAFAVKKSVAVVQALRPHARQPERVYFIGHQANLRMLQTVCGKADIPADRHLFNVDRFGNCGAAGAPSVLSQNWEKFRDGDEIALVCVGAGLSWSGALIQVGE